MLNTGTCDLRVFLDTITFPRGGGRRSREGRGTGPPKHCEEGTLMSVCAEVSAGLSARGRYCIWYSDLSLH